MLTLGDKVLIAVILCCALVGLFIVPGLRTQGSYAVVETEHDSGLSLPLSEDGEWRIQGPLGETVVEIKDGCVRVERSPCPHKLCIRMGCRNRYGDIIACIPNGVIVRVQGEKSVKAVDGITR